MTDRLRDLAGKLDKATPGPWEVDRVERSIIYGKKGLGCACSSSRDARAICLARNECPALLREAADEIERLRRIAKIMATAIWYRHDTPEATMTANEFLNDPTTKEAQ